MWKKSIATILISISIIMVIIYYVMNSWDALTDSIQLLVGIAAIASGISSIIMSVSSIRTSRFEAIKEYYLNGDTPEMQDCRKYIYMYEEGTAELNDQAASQICSYFHFWGMMVEENYLPIWIFKSASGPSIVRMYYILEDYIKDKRAVNKFYAYHFETLVKKIEKKYGFNMTENHVKLRRKKANKRDKLV